jgi:hypothetical protein
MRRKQEFFKQEFSRKMLRPRHLFFGVRLMKVRKSRAKAIEKTERIKIAHPAEVGNFQLGKGKTSSTTQ